MTDNASKLNRANRKILKLEDELAELRVKHRHVIRDVSTLRQLVRRRTWALWTGFVTLEGKAGYGMAISEWGDYHWWANFGQASGLLIAVGYLMTPNIRKLLRLSSDVPGTENEETA